MPVTSRIAPLTRSMNGPGWVRTRRRSTAPIRCASACARRPPLRRGLDQRAAATRLWQSLKRMLKRARASAGIRLTVELPMSIEVNSRFDGPKCAVPLSSGCVDQRDHQRHEAAHRIVGALGIGDVALLAGDDERAVLRAAPADLDHVAERFAVGRLAQDA